MVVRSADHDDGQSVEMLDALGLFTSGMVRALRAEAA